MARIHLLFRSVPNATDCSIVKDLIGITYLDVSTRSNQPFESSINFYEVVAKPRNKIAAFNISKNYSPRHFAAYSKCNLVTLVELLDIAMTGKE